MLYNGKYDFSPVDYVNAETSAIDIMFYNAYSRRNGFIDERKRPSGTTGRPSGTTGRPSGTTGRPSGTIPSYPNLIRSDNAPG
jgi:hypothetical protein